MCGRAGRDCSQLRLFLTFSAACCAGALTYLHAHDVLHGDLTPSNVLLTSSTKDGRRWQAKINDFGLAAVMGGVDAVRRSCRLGTGAHSLFSHEAGPSGAGAKLLG